MTVLWDRTRCSRGHEMTSDNTSKDRRCIACHQEAAATLRSRRIASGGACPRCSTPYTDDSLYADGGCNRCARQRAKVWAEGVKVRGWTRTQCYRGHDLTIGKNVTGDGRCRVCRLEGHRKRRQERLASGASCPLCSTPYSEDTLLPDGRCRPCGQARATRYFASETGQLAYQRSKEAMAAARKADPTLRRKQNATSRRSRIFTSYRLTLEQYEALQAAQNGACAVCGRYTPGKLHLDHDHRCCPTGAKSCGRCVRAFLCHGCNVAIGFAGDNPKRLRDLADYVARHRERIASMSPMQTAAS